MKNPKILQVATIWILINMIFAAVSSCCFSQSIFAEEQIKKLPDEYEGYKECADEGDIRCQFYVGLMYYFGRGVTQDYAEASKWYRKAADQGHATAQHFLGIMYESGKGVTQDYTEAGKWYRKSADQGNDMDQCILGEMYENGKGVIQDHAEAAKWYRKAADQGYSHAQYHLGLMYSEGRGVPQDYILANMWIILSSASLGNYEPEKAETIGNAIEKKMTAQQIAEAQRLAREWKATKGK